MPFPPIRPRARSEGFSCSGPRRRGFLQAASSSAGLLLLTSLAGAPGLAQAQLFGRTAGLAPLLLGPDSAPPPTRAFELIGRTRLAQRVMLGSFTVEFVQQQLRLVPPSGVAIGVPDAAMQFADVRLAGLDDAALQAATDSVYTAWVDACRAAGVDVLPPQALLASAQWSAVADAGQRSGGVKASRGAVTRTFAPQGLVVNGIGMLPADAGLPLPSGGVADALQRGLGQVREVADLARAAFSGQALEPLAGALGAQLLSVRLVVGIVEVRDELAGHPQLRATSDNRTRLGLHLDARNTQVVVSAPGGMDDARTLRLRLPMLMPGVVVQSVEAGQVEPTDASRMVTEALLGWRSATRTTRHTVQVDGPAYGRQAAASLTALAQPVFKALQG